MSQPTDMPAPHQTTGERLKDNFKGRDGWYLRDKFERDRNTVALPKEPEKLLELLRQHEATYEPLLEAAQKARVKRDNAQTAYDKAESERRKESDRVAVIKLALKDAIGAPL